MCVAVEYIMKETNIIVVIMFLIHGVFIPATSEIEDSFWGIFQMESAGVLTGRYTLPIQSKWEYNNVAGSFLPSAFEIPCLSMGVLYSH